MSLSQFGTYIHETLENYKKCPSNFNNLTKLEKEIITKINLEKQRQLEDLSLDSEPTNLRNIIQKVCSSILTNSDCFDVVIQCKNGQFNCHKIILKYISSFGYFQDFTDNLGIVELKVDTYIEFIKCIMEYLYCANLIIIEPRLIELLIQVDFFGLLTNNLEDDNWLIKTIMMKISKRITRLLDFLFENYNFEQFMNIVRMAYTIIDKNIKKIGLDWNLQNNLGSWFKNNYGKYDLEVVKKSVLFEKLVTTPFGQQIIIETLDFNKFPLVVNDGNCEKLLNIIFKAEPENMYDIIMQMNGSGNCNNYIFMQYANKFPISILDSKMYHENNDISFKISLICKFKKYELLNGFVNLDDDQNRKILRINDIFHSNTNDLCYKILQSSLDAQSGYFRHINHLTTMKQKILANIIITNYYPLKFYYCVRVGTIISTIFEDTKYGLKISLDTDAYFVPITKGTKLLVQNNIMEIDQMFIHDTDIMIEKDTLVNIRYIAQTCTIFFTNENKNIVNGLKNVEVLLIIMKL